MGEVQKMKCSRLLILMLRLISIPLLVLISACNSSNPFPIGVYRSSSSRIERATLEGDQLLTKTTTVYFFFSPQCPLSLKQLPQLTLLQDKYRFNCIIVFPNLDSLNINALKKLGIPKGVTIYFDSQNELASFFRAKVTPQYVLCKDEKILFSGPLDNSMKAINSPNQEPYKNYLENILSDLQLNKIVSPITIKPVGCYIF
jgi:thiol-disulfide isomerase/thioredoxin